MYRSSKLYLVALGLLFSVAANAGWLNNIIGYSTFEECYDEKYAELLTRDSNPLPRGRANHGARVFCDKYPTRRQRASIKELRQEIAELRRYDCSSWGEDRVLQGLCRDANDIQIEQIEKEIRSR